MAQSKPKASVLKLEFRLKERKNQIWKRHLPSQLERLDSAYKSCVKGKLGKATREKKRERRREGDREKGL